MKVAFDVMTFFMPFFCHRSFIKLVEQVIYILIEFDGFDAFVVPNIFEFCVFSNCKEMLHRIEYSEM